MFDPFPAWPDWTADAKCAGDNIERYISSNLGTGPGVARKAAKLCDGCPVIRECLVDTVRFDTRGVVRGGMAFSDDAHKAYKLRVRIAEQYGVPLPPVLGRKYPQRKYCVNGHKMTPQNTRIRSSDGARTCVACREEHARRYAERKRAKRQQQKGVA